MIAAEKIYETRENICSLFHITDPLCLAFTANTTEALNIGIKGILKPGDHVITTSMEHNSVIRPIKKLESEGVHVSIVKAGIDGMVEPADIENNIRINTKLIVMTHASNVTGTINPIIEIGRIAKKHNILFMVDGAQTAGVYPIDVNQMNIDILAFPGHKGLLGPQGTGGIYINSSLNLLTLKEGGTGSNSESFEQPDFSPDRYESGTLNTPGIAGLNEGVKYILKNGIDEIRVYESELTQYMLEGLHNIKNVTIYGADDLTRRVGVISMNINGKDCVEISTELDNKYNIASRSGLHCSSLAHNTIGTFETGTIRLSLGCYTTKKHINTTLKAINELAK
jgi:cysteine desulfurase family protein